MAVATGTVAPPSFGLSVGLHHRQAARAHPPNAEPYTPPPPAPLRPPQWKRITQGCTGPFIFLRVSRRRVNSAPGQAAQDDGARQPGQPYISGLPGSLEKYLRVQIPFFFSVTRGNKTLWGEGGEGKTIYSYLDYMENCYKAPNTRCDSVPLLAEVCTRKV